MRPLMIACLSQKGGVGKSTIARLLARTYSVAGWDVKIADFNVSQLTSVDWVAARMAAGIEPAIAAEPFTTVKALDKVRADIIIADGRPDSDQSSLDLARKAHLCVIPTGLSVDDLKPQLLFANELKKKGVPHDRLLFVFNKTTESQVSLNNAKDYLRSVGYNLANTDLPTKTNYQNAQDAGLSVSETKTASLNERADQLAAEIVDQINALEELAA